MKTKLTLLFSLAITLSAPAQVSPPDAIIDGKTIPEWTAEWWKWIYAQATNQSPLFDSDGSNATNGQPGGSVFFLANIPTPGTATRAFTVPQGSYLLFPVRYVTLDNVDFPIPLSVAELRDEAATVVALMTNLHVTIDGLTVDVSSHRVLSPIFNFDFQSPDNLDSFIDGHPVMGLVDPIVSDGYWIMLEPLPAGDHLLTFGGQIGPPYNSSKDITDHITVVSGTQRPVADASATVARVLSPNNRNARVVLDGSRSSDSNGAILNATWVEGSSVIATGTVSVAILNVGTHQISLIVSDDSLSATNTMAINIITAAEAVRELAALVHKAHISSKLNRPLVDPLEDAREAFHHGNFAAGINQLEQFEDEVQEDLARNYPITASQLTHSAQEIIDAVNPLLRRVEELLSFLTTSSLAPKIRHELLPALQETEKDFQADAWREGIEDLEGFQQKLRHRLGQIDPALADEFIQEAQKIIEIAKAQ